MESNVRKSREKFEEKQLTKKEEILKRAEKAEADKAQTKL